MFVLQKSVKYSFRICHKQQWQETKGNTWQCLAAKKHRTQSAHWSALRPAQGLTQDFVLGEGLKHGGVRPGGYGPSPEIFKKFLSNHAFLAV